MGKAAGSKARRTGARMRRRVRRPMEILNWLWFDWPGRASGGGGTLGISE